MIGSAVLTHQADDLIDALLTRTRGEVLYVTGDGGECDFVRAGHVTVRDMQRLRAGGLVSSHGIEADRLAMVYGWEGDCSAFVEHWVCQGLAGLRARRERREGGAWSDSPDDPELAGPVLSPTELPIPLVEYLGRLVFGLKADYAAEYAYHLVHGEPCPADPGTDWARKARGRVDWYLRSAVK